MKPSTADRAIVIAHGVLRYRGREGGRTAVDPLNDAFDNDSSLLEDIVEVEKEVEVEDGGHDTGYAVSIDFTVTVLR